VTNCADLFNKATARISTPVWDFCGAFVAIDTLIHNYSKAAYKLDSPVISANCANGILPLLAGSSRGNAFSSLEPVLLRAFCHDDN